MIREHLETQRTDLSDAFNRNFFVSHVQRLLKYVTLCDHTEACAMLFFS